MHHLESNILITATAFSTLTLLLIIVESSNRSTMISHVRVTDRLNGMHTLLPRDISYNLQRFLHLYNKIKINSYSADLTSFSLNLLLLREGFWCQMRGFNIFCYLFCWLLFMFIQKGFISGHFVATCFKMWQGNRGTEF